MRVLWLGFAIASSLLAREDPRATSIHPFTGQRGVTFSATVRGSGLTGARAAALGNAPLKITVVGVDPEPASESSGLNKIKIDLVRVRVEVAADAKPGHYPIRIITPNGISNSLPLHIVDLPVLAEPPGAHESQESAVPVSKLPAIYTGRLARRGESDYYAFHAEAGQELTFEANSGFPQIASAGSAATVAKFDPAITVYDRAGSWFNSQRLNRIAYNDEPVWVFGKPTDARLTHRFAKAGDYLVRIDAFAGQGGPDYSYELKIVPGAVPPEAAPGSPKAWDERGWTRRLNTERLSDLAIRGGDDARQPAIETYRAAAEPHAFKIPGTLEGTLDAPGTTHRARFHLDQPADIALELETPAAAPPYFNPIFRLLNNSGQEVASNIFAGKGACTGAMTKSMQGKTILPLRDTGDYTLEIRDATADLAGADFKYRLLVRPQIPHVGEIRVDADAVNVEQGRAKTVHVSFDREEGYRGAVIVAVDSLPSGVSAIAAMDFEPEKDPPPALGKRERYVPRSNRIVLVISAEPSAAPPSLPQDVRLVVRPLVDGKPGAVLTTKTIPLMVIPKS